MAATETSVSRTGHTCQRRARLFIRHELVHHSLEFTVRVGPSGSALSESSCAISSAGATPGSYSSPRSALSRAACT